MTDDQAEAILEEWDDCVDLPALRPRGERPILLDEDGVACFEDELREAGPRRLPPRSFTSDDADAGRAMLNQIVGLCSRAGPGGTGGVLVDAIAESFADHGTLDLGRGPCMAQHVRRRLGADKLVGIGGGELLADAPEDVQKDFATVLLNAAESGDLDLSKIG